MKRTLVCLASTMILACDGRGARNDVASAPITGPKVALFDLSGGLPEKTTPNVLSLSTPPPSFDDFLRRTAQVGKDADARGAFVSFNGPLGMARALEVGQALGALRQAGKAVHCHAHAYDNATLLASALGCDRITVSPAGEIEAIGLAGQVVYLRKLLADELKMSIDILQVGKFKGAEEPLTRDGPSDEARASLMGLLSSFRDSWKGQVRAARGEIAADALEKGPFTPNEGPAQKLIDGVAYADDALRALKESVQVAREELVLGKNPTTGRGNNDADLGELIKTLAGADGNREPIALVKAVGGISMANDGGMFGGGGGITERELGSVVRKLRRDDTVKAVVLRIDSPGGSALASDLLWHELMQLREKKPIVVSVGEMAASGGYYLASTGSWILASELSLVGSIGVVGGKVGVGGALEHWGVHTETFPANAEDPGAAARAAYLSPLVAWDEPIKARVLASMEGIYDLFLARVAEGRRIPVEKVAASAEGRVWSGVQGKERGLVDEIGGLERAIVKARELAQLPADAGVRRIGEKPAWLEALGAEGAGASTTSAAIGAAAAEQVKASAPGLGALIGPQLTAASALLTPLLAGERVLCMDPFLVHVR